MKTLLLACFLFISMQAISQATQGYYEYQKVKQPAMVLGLPYSNDLTQGALKEFMLKRTGSKPAESKGMLIYRNVMIGEGEYADLYFDIERKSRREKMFCTINVLAARPNENLATRAADDKFGMANAQLLLNDFSPAIIAYALEQEIKAQQDVITKVERKYTTLMADSVDLQKRRASLDERIANNSKEQETQRKEAERQKQALELLLKKKQ